MDLEFNDLTYTVFTRNLKGVKKSREILKSVSGKFKSGQLSAIMGPSGAGKTSLLNALSGFRSEGVCGELLAGGHERKRRDFHKRSCYITQDDLLQPLLTAGELMSLAAALKMPAGMPRRSTCAAIFANMGLSGHEDTRTDLLSGGQKKRLSIALELVNNPPIFFLDEPTSGLDQVTSSHCIKLLQTLARQGRTVVCTIHQPSASIFENFDHVYVIAQGVCVYQGATSTMVPFLSSVGLHCPRHHNPADFIIETTESQANITMLSQWLKNGKVHQAAIEERHNDNLLTKDQLELLEKSLEEIIPSDKSQVYSNGDTKHQDSKVSDTLQANMEWLKMSRMSTDLNMDYATSPFMQFKILFARMMLQLRRNTTAITIQTVHHILCGTLIGLCFMGTANDGNLMFEHLKFCIGVTIFFAYTQIMVPVLLSPKEKNIILDDRFCTDLQDPGEVKLVKKEYFNRWYGLAPYYLALNLSKLPLQITLNVVFCSIVYIMWGMPLEFFRFTIFCIVGNMVSLAAEGVGLAIGSRFSITNGCAMGPLAIAPFLGLAIYGFDFAKNIPWIMNLLMKTSFIRRGVVALALTVFGFDRKPLECNDVYCHFAKPQVLLDYLDIKRTSVWFEILSMGVIMLLFRSFVYMNLRQRFST